MMSAKTFYQAMCAIFSVLAVAHLLRILFNVSVVVGDWRVPLKVSFLGVVVAGFLAYNAYKLSQKKKAHK